MISPPPNDFILVFAINFNENKSKLDTWVLGWLVGWLVVRFKANCPLIGPEPIGGMPSVGGGGVFLWDPSPY